MKTLRLWPLMLLLCGLPLLAACGTAGSGTTGDAGTGTATATTGGTATAATGGPSIAQIDKPFQTTITNGRCSADKPGLEGFLFPNTGYSINTPILGFAIGPDQNTPTGQQNNPPFNGPGTYTHIFMSGQAAGGTPYFMGFGTVVIHPDNQTGTFALDDGSASGSFDCGHTLSQ